MTQPYLCRLEDDEDWTPVNGFGPEDAVGDFIEKADNDSGGELCNGDAVIVFAKDGDRIVAYEVSADWIKSFAVCELDDCPVCKGRVPLNSCLNSKCPLRSASGSQPAQNLAEPSRVAPSGANSGQPQSEAGAAFDSIVNAKL